ncbi:Uncharacterised protein [Mycobacteroides abscessus subsp. abscessus]|nr:Uncharacterised protein [Mycobacteroides abscessus subsp. abscessus]
MPLRRRSPSTASRTADASVRSPCATPSSLANSGYRIGALSPSVDRPNSTSSTTRALVPLRMLVR